MYIMSENKEKTAEKQEQNFANLEDSDLIFEITKKNNSAFEEFFKRYANKVKFLMLKMGAKDLDAEEISQEVMAILWRKAFMYDSKKSSVSSWVYTIARNCRIDFLRRGNRVVLDSDDPTFVPDPPLNSVQLLMKYEKQDRIRLILKQLTEEKKQLLTAAFFEGLSHSELAKKFNKPLGTIKSRLRLIYDSLRDAEDLKILSGPDD